MIPSINYGFLPYFLAAGKHITQDIPVIITKTMLRFPDIDYEISSHLGANLDLPAMVAGSLLKK